MCSCLVVKMIVLVTCVQTSRSRHFSIKLISLHKIRSPGTSTNSAVPHHVTIISDISQIWVQCWSCCLGTLLGSVPGKCGQAKWLQFLKSISVIILLLKYSSGYKTRKISFKIEDWIIHLIFQISCSASVGIGDYAFANCF